MPARLLLLGPPSLDLDGAVEQLPFDRRHQLLAALALRAGWVPRSELATLLWPGRSDKLAYTNLRKTLFRLQDLTWAAALEAQGHALRLELATDVAAFDAAIRERRLADALGLWRGEFLAGFDDAANEAWTEWLLAERERLRALWRAAALERVASGGDGGIELSAQLLELDALDEAALRAHVEALVRAGQNARAQGVWRSFTERLQRELGVEPSAELRAWHAALARPLAAQAMVEPMPASAPARAMVAIDGFVGRSGELHRLASLLAQGEGRLLTLVGPGGVGKTRLARRLLDDRAAGYRDGGVFVPLEDLHDASQVGHRIAREIGLALAGRHDALTQVIQALAARQTLLVLDNLEQLEGGAQVIEQLRSSCPQLHLVVTSRVRLALAAEQLMPLQGLPSPDAEDADRLEAFDAARLFIRAAQRVEPALVPAAEAAAIAEICRLVDGLPLALELAAAWTRTMSCEAIAEELRRGTELLSTADPTRPGRHASVAAVFEQAWAHLGEAERRALAALSVFRGPFSVEAARRVAAAPPPVLAALSDRWLLRKADASRLQLHPLVQQFAAQRLAQGGAAQAVATAHARHMLGQLVQREEALSLADRQALRETDHDFEDVRTAWQFALQAGLHELLARTVRALTSHCDHRGRLSEGRALMMDAAAALGDAEAPILRARLLAFGSHLAYRLDDYQAARASAEHLMADPVAAGDAVTRQQCLRLLGSISLQTGSLGEARQYFQRAHDDAAAAGKTLQAAAMLDNLATIEKRSGRYDEARQLAQRSLVLLRRAGAHADVALCLNGLGTLHLARLDLDAAQACFDEGLAICEREGFVNTRGHLLANLAEVAIMRGDLDAATRHVERAISLGQAHGYRGIVAWMQMTSARIARIRGDLPHSRAALAEGITTAREIGLMALLAGSLMPWAELLHAQGELDIARRMLAFAAAHPMTAAPDRDEMQRLLQRWGGAGAAPWPEALSLEALLPRAVLEAPAAYAPLIHELRPTA